MPPYMVMVILTLTLALAPFTVIALLFAWLIHGLRLVASGALELDNDDE